MNKMLINKNALLMDDFVKLITEPSNLDLINNQKHSSSDKSPKYFFIKVGSSIVKVFLNKINYIEGLKDYIKIHVDKESLITKCTIKHIENKLPSETFVRVHKSYIISIDKIDKIEYNHIFIGSKKIPIGMQFKEPFYNKVNQNRL